MLPLVLVINTQHPLPLLRDLSALGTPQGCLSVVRFSKNFTFSDLTGHTNLIGSQILIQ